MWLPLVLLALMASGSACPYLCECHQNDGEKDPPLLVDVTCRGRVPGLSEIPAEARSLSVESAEGLEVVVLLDELETADTTNDTGMIDSLDDGPETNATSSGEEPTARITELLPHLVELAVTNCSLVSLNASWHGLERLRALNLSCNNLLRIRDALSSQAMNLSELTCLDLSDNSLLDVSVGTFRTLVRLVRLSLRRNAITTVDADAFRGLGRLEFLDLSDNRLADLPDSALTPLYSLQKLDLSGNQLQVLGARWFESLDRLRELDVSRNGLARAASGTLQPLSGLSVLRLAENPLREKDVSLLLGTGRRLETVDASRTGLARVPAALTRSVRALRLAGNRLTVVRSGDLDSYPLLRIFDIADNRLVDIEEDALGRLEVLNELDLSGNLLSKVPGSLPSSLTILKLQRNAITALRLDDLNGLYNLRSLLLNDNDISVIEVGALGQLLLLTELDLSDNPIKALPTNALSGPSNLAKLRMSGLTSLRRHREEQSDMAFPVPTPERLITLDVSRSPVLASQLLADDAALSACKSLAELNLSETNITTVRSDLAYMLPQLRTLGLGNNDWNCTKDLYWLGEFIRQRGDEPSHRRRRFQPARCSGPREFAGLLLHELPTPPNSRAVHATVDPREASVATLSVVLALERTSPTDRPNVTASSDIDATDSGRNITNWPALSFARAESVTRRVTEGNENDAADVARNATATATDESPRIYQAPTSFRNATSSIATRTSVDEEPIDLGSDKTNRTRMRQSSIRLADVVPTARTTPRYDPVQSVTRTGGESRSHAHDNRTDRETRKNGGKTSKLAALPDEIVSPEVVAQRGRERASGGATIGKYSLGRANGTAAFTGVRDTNTIAEELNGRATDSGARVSETLSAGAHPGMLVLAGAALGAVAALSVVLSRRASVSRADRYQRHENIEVHTLTPTTELW